METHPTRGDRKCHQKERVAKVLKVNNKYVMVHEQNLTNDSISKFIAYNLIVALIFMLIC